jgi:poly-gamma-glutamate capsule biosynthesis protein CapA/YwtB (metallophosphatase superfamily)
LRLILLGDVMLGRLVNRQLAVASPMYPWGDTLPVLRAADAVILNLECVLADRGEPWPGKVFTFRTDSRNVAVLTGAPVTAVSLANNHSLDFGRDALQDCIATLVQHEIQPAGAGRSADLAWRPATFSAAGVRVAVLAVTDNMPEWEARVDTPGVYYVSLQRTDPRFTHLLNAIEEAREQHDLVIVSAHWGPNWGYAPPPDHVEAAHRFIDRGADVVFGHSPHVYRGVALHRGKPILFSCGDYLDDYAVDDVERNDESFIWRLEVKDRRLCRLALIPTMIRACQATLAQGADRVRIVERMRALCAALGTETAETPEGITIRIDE